MSENKNGHGRRILYGYIRPFTGKGFVPFIVSFGLALIPFVQVVIFSIACSDAPALRGGGLKRLVTTSLKMLLAALLLFAPALAMYLITHILGNMLRTGPGWLAYIPAGLMLLLAVSALIRLPMAMAALAKGLSLREAVSGRFIKLLIGACFGRYAASLLCLFPFVVLALFIALMPLWLSYVYSAFITAWMLSYLGYAVSCCCDKAAPALGLPAGPPPAAAGGGGRYARTAVSMLLVTAILGQLGGALAFDEDEALASGNYPTQHYTAAEYDAAYSRFIQNGQLNKYTEMRYNADTGNFYCVAKPTGTGDTPAVRIALELTADCLPVISTIKNSYEFYQYKKIADDPTRSAAERAAAKRMQYYKFFSAALGVAGPLGKVASMVTGKGIVPFLIVKAGSAVTDPRMAAIISAADDALWGWDRVSDCSKLAGLVGKELGDAWGELAPEGVLGVKPSPSLPPSGAGTTQDAPEETIPSGDYAPFWGTYKGTLVCPYNSMEAYGVTGAFPNPEMTVTLDEEGYMSLSYTFNSTFTYDSGYGISMSGDTTLPVDIKNVYLTRTLAGYMGDYDAGSFTAATSTRYAGEAYEDGGGELSSSLDYRISFSVIFSMVNLNGKVQTVASGTVTQTPLAGNEAGAQSMVMSFEITKTA